VYIGPADLSLALGCTPAFDDVAAPVAQAIEHILARAGHHGVKAGIHTGTPEGAAKRIEQGFAFVTVGSDVRLMADGAQQILGRMARVEPAPSTNASMLGRFQI
jgi:4-hydroxy-2-oxoheptanedioate aldolase